MAAATEHAPRWINAILDWQPTWVLARVAIASAYLLGGIEKLSDFPSAMAEQAHFGLQPAGAWAAAAIVVELGGSLLLIAGRLVWLAAGGLAVLTAIAAFVAGDFWTMQGHERFMAMNTLFERFGLIAGLAMAAMLARHRR
jgi:uncharacterized membrane protein YphA (DoxX/SURF4 family)